MWLASHRRVSASTEKQVLSALLLLYRHVRHLEIDAIEHLPRARMPIRVPVVLSRDEVARIMKHLDGVARLEDGYDIRTVQELLGHADVSTTMVYTHVLNRGPLGARPRRSSLKERSPVRLASGARGQPRS